MLLLLQLVICAAAEEVEVKPDGTKAETFPPGLGEDHYISREGVNTTLCLETLLALPLYTYFFKYDLVPGRRQLGVVGPELKRRIPESVTVLAKKDFPNPARSGPRMIPVHNYHSVDHNMLLMYSIAGGQALGTLAYETKAKTGNLTEEVVSLSSILEKFMADVAEEKAKQVELYKTRAQQLAVFDADGTLSVGDGMSFSNSTLNAPQIGAFTAVGPIDFNSQDMKNVAIDGGFLHAVEIAGAPSIEAKAMLCKGTIESESVTASNLLQAGQMIRTDGSIEGGTITASGLLQAKGALIATEVSVSGNLKAAAIDTAGELKATSARIGANVSCFALSATESISTHHLSSSGIMNAQQLYIAGSLEVGGSGSVGAEGEGAEGAEGQEGEAAAADPSLYGGIRTKGLIEAGTMLVQGTVNAGKIETNSIESRGQVQTASVVATGSVTSVSFNCTGAVGAGSLHSDGDLTAKGRLDCKGDASLDGKLFVKEEAVFVGKISGSTVESTGGITCGGAGLTVAAGGAVDAPTIVASESLQALRSLEVGKGGAKVDGTVEAKTIRATGRLELLEGAGAGAAVVLQVGRIRKKAVASQPGAEGEASAAAADDSDDGDGRYRLQMDGDVIAKGGITCSGEAGLKVDAGAYVGEMLHVGGEMLVDGGVTSGGSVSGAGPYTDSSDRRLKTNVTAVGGREALKMVMALRGVRYDWRHDEFPKRRFEQGTQIGFIAQEVEEVLPETVRTRLSKTKNTGKKSEEGGDEGEGGDVDQNDPWARLDSEKSVAYSRVVPVLVEAVKEQQRSLTTMRATAEAQQQQMEQQVQQQVQKQLAGLRAENDDLRARLDAQQTTIDKLVSALGR
jgi:hypothetical protein